MNVYPVIMAGSSGTRFWPLSRKAKPKQFLSLATDKALIAETALRLKGVAPLSRTFVVCGQAHAAAVKRSVKGLPGKNVLVEPTARNTAPAIALATLHVAAQDPDGILVVLPSDQHVSDPKGFREALSLAARIAEFGSIVTLGIKPTRAETGYGYIQLGDALPSGGHSVKAFKEKPDRLTAERYVSSPEYLWNGGIFIFRAQVMLEALRAHAPELDRGLEPLRKAKKKDYARVLAKVFPKLPNISIDYAVMEKASNIAVVPGDFGWSDVGSFAALPEVRPADARGNVVLGEKHALVVDCDGCVVVAKDRPLAVVGLREMVVVDSGDAVLVVPKSESQEVKKAVEALKARKLERFL